MFKKILKVLKIPRGGGGSCCLLTSPLSLPFTAVTLWF